MIRGGHNVMHGRLNAVLSGKLTATGKEQALVDFYAQLRRDAEARPGVFPRNASELAARAKVGRAYLARVLNCDTTGANTWKHVLPLLSVEALFHLKQCSAWNIYAERALAALVRETTGASPVRTDLLRSPRAA